MYLVWKVVEGSSHAHVPYPCTQVISAKELQRRGKRLMSMGLVLETINQVIDDVLEISKLMKSVALQLAALLE